ncbi:MAG: SIR2 family NAD-dependent protein deacylase [Actinomycetota bacterium]
MSVGAAIEEVARLVAGGGVVAFTGAGISAESGIPTFRDPGGLWERYDPSDFGTWDGVMRTAMSAPDRLAEFLSELRKVFGEARPSAAHRALARLEGAGLVEGVVTQNVDGLHQEAGSTHVIEVHGSFARVSCLAAGHRSAVTREEFLEGLDRAILGLRTAFVPSFASILPRCPECGAPARPDFVAFGEAVHDLEQAERLVAGCRVLLVVGTSGEVYPVAGLPHEARASGATVVEIAKGETFVEADLRLRGEAGTVLPAIAQMVGAIGPGA